MADINDLIPKDVYGFSDDGKAFPAPEARGWWTINDDLDKLIWIVRKQGERIEFLDTKIEAMYT